MTHTVTSPYANYNMERIAEWTAQMLDAAAPTATLIGCSPEAVVAQAALETGWGRSVVGKNNLFGIKDTPDWTGAKVLVTTQEVVNGETVTIQAWFRDYPNYAASLADHFAFLKENTRYANVFDPNDSMSDQEYFRRLQADGYATDPNYAQSLMDMLKSIQSLEAHMTQKAAA